MFQLNFVMNHLIWGSDFDCRIAVQQVHTIVSVNAFEIDDVLEIQTDKHVGTDKRCKSGSCPKFVDCPAEHLQFQVVS